MSGPSTRLLPVFDLDGTLLDSDGALADAFVALGVDRATVTFGHVLAAECERLGVSLDAYLGAYDCDAAQPFDGVEDLLATLDRWAVVSNKHPRSGTAELVRLGWRPEVALFSNAFGGGPKRLEPVLDALGVGGHEVALIGDTGHDRACARQAGAAFVLAGWNARARAEPGDLVARCPAEVRDLLA